MKLPQLDEIRNAAAIVYKTMPPTPLIRWPLVCGRTGADVCIKHENHSPVGSFKLRGGLLYMHKLSHAEPNVSGVIAATRGNHGQSIALAAARSGLRSVIVVPHGNSREKNAAMQALGAELRECGSDFQEAYEQATRMAQVERLHMVPSFDRTLVCGVSTYALELFEAVPDLDDVYVPIGMGSGMCGVISARNALGLKTRVIGVVAAGAPAYAQSFVAGQVVPTEVARTIADGMACRTPEADAVGIIKKGAERIVTVSDDAICAAMRHLFSDTHNTAEGAGASALAALLQECEFMRGRRIAVILTGGNVDRDVFARILAEDE